MKINTLPKITKTSKKRLGQGHGSGRVKTSGRGTKGAKVRGKVPMMFEGGNLPLTKRLPFLRGKGRNYAIFSKKEILNVTKLNIFKDDEIIDVKKLIDAKLVDIKMALAKGVKIVGKGELSKKLSVKLPLTKGARESIEKAHGKILDE